MRAEVHTIGEAPDVVFTTRVQALSAIAKQAMAAKARGDTLAQARLMAQFRATLGRDDLPALVAQAKAADMPSGVMLALSQFSETATAGLGNLFKTLPLLLALAVVGWLVLQARRRE